jgi:uncharacterized protein YfbU (UPF0304 family)
MAALSERFEMRLDEDTLESVDKWRAKQGDVPSRAEAMRRLIELGLLRSSSESIRLSDGEKLLLLMLGEVYKHLKVKGESEPDFLANVIYDGHFWAPKWKMPGVFHDYEDDPRDLPLTLDVLEMWDCIERGWERLSKKDKERVEKDADPFGSHVKFTGFDGNNEATYIGIARCLVEQLDRFSRFKGRDLNSHAPVLATYRRMLNVFTPMKKTFSMGGELNADQLVRVLNAMRYSD